MFVVFRQRIYRVYRSIAQQSLEGIKLKPDEYILVDSEDAIVIRGNFVDRGYSTSMEAPKRTFLKDNLRDSRKNELEKIQKLLNKT